MITDILFNDYTTPKGAQKNLPQELHLWKVHGHLVPETKIEPVRPLLTKRRILK
jgi:hypothetical protein